ncbi:hypothetical protein O9G_000662 [Rozella allomycis CSF55]|uniref:Uncharacterized protein n=1 Tax=Rozella allomycis (strain CSF55) TaxID=988480 RepID=A0A075B2R8_ROZAC|nr:hypothetical protein O9G_000662 [Rozella allomycis CSF55]|eukprot:EPZ35266.1 hypothetical protein O9G_000662 [Rozella allomycis CSF55]
MIVALTLADGNELKFRLALIELEVLKLVGSELKLLDEKGFDEGALAVNGLFPIVLLAGGLVGFSALNGACETVLTDGFIGTRSENGSLLGGLMNPWLAVGAISGTEGVNIFEFTEWNGCIWDEENIFWLVGT